MIFADSYFCIGKQHANEGKPCQDYAVTQVDGDGAIAVVSDGCSTGEKTDIGARIVALSSLNINTLDKAGEAIENNESIRSSLKTSIVKSGQMIGLRPNDLLATSLSIYFHKGYHIHEDYYLARIYGDGVIAYKNSFGHITATKYEWDKGTPFYLVYDSSDFLNQVCNGDLFSQVAKSETHYFDKYWSHSFSAEPMAFEGLNGFPSHYSAKNILSVGTGEAFLAVFSDGITQIKDFDWKDAVFEFMNYKSTSGEFVKRRMMKALKTMTPMDDIACAALRITPDADK